MASNSHQIPDSIPRVLSALVRLVRSGRSGSSLHLTSFTQIGERTSSEDLSCLWSEEPKQNDTQCRPFGRLPYAF